MRTFRGPVLAVALAFRGDRIPAVLRAAAAGAAIQAMQWLDRRRERLDGRVL